MTTLVFVYGTLKKSFPNHYLLEEKNDVKFISDGVTFDKYPMVIDSPYKIPFILNDVGKGTVSHLLVVKRLYTIDFAM